MKISHILLPTLLAILICNNSSFAQSGRKKETVITPATTELDPRQPRSERPPRGVLVPPAGLVEIDLPEHLVYQEVFRIVQVGWSPEETRLKISPRFIGVCISYQRAKILSEKQNKIVLNVANETLFELNKIDERMMVLVKEFREKLRAGVRTQGDRRIEPPKEAEELEQKSKELLEGAILRLKKELGDKAFAKFNDFVKEKFAPGMKGVSLPIPQ